VISVPATVALNHSRVHIAENGQAVRSFALASLRHAGLGEFGIVLLIDSSQSMSGAPLRHAMQAARALAALRSGGQELAVDTFSQRPTVLVPLTSDRTMIERGLVSVPRARPGTRFLPAMELALRQLDQARIAVGAVILVSDGANREPGATPQTIAAMAAARHVQIFTVGVRDGSYTSGSMVRLADIGGGTFISTASSARLRGIVASVDSRLESEYVLHYRSAQAFGRQVAVTVTVSGVPGGARFTYRSPAPPGAAPLTRDKARPSFWASSLAVALVAVACAVLIGLAVGILHTYFARSGRLRARVQAFIPSPPRQPTVALKGPEGRDLSSRWHRLLERRRWWPAFVHQVDLSGSERSANEWASIAVTISLLAALAIELLSGSVPLALVGLLAGPLTVRFLIRRLVRQQLLRFGEQLPGQLHEIASAMRTGRSLVEALGLVADSAEEPLRREFQRALADERAGLLLDEALHTVAARMESSEIEQVALIAELQRRTGANIAEVLDRVADSAQQRVEIRRELRTLTAQARLSRNVLTALPLFVLIGVDIVGRGYERPLLHTTPGLLVLAAGAVMVALGAKVMKKMVDIEE
jgi:tight adherence protein B